jgi:hypothetical protein
MLMRAETGHPHARQTLQPDCTALYCTTATDTVLYCIVLYCTVLHST